MNVLRPIMMLMALAICSSSAMTQNVMLNVLTQNSGVVKIGKTVFLEVSVNNTDATQHVASYTLRPQVSIPSSILKIEDHGHVLPAGWVITSKSDSSLVLTNGTDVIYPHEARTILIALKGIAKGGPMTLSGNLSFSTGSEPGSAIGISTPGDMVADNVSTTTCKVEK